MLQQIIFYLCHQYNSYRIVYWSLKFISGEPNLNISASERVFSTLSIYSKLGLTNFHRQINVKAFSFIWRLSYLKPKTTPLGLATHTQCRRYRGPLPLTAFLPPLFGAFLNSWFCLKQGCETCANLMLLQLIYKYKP